MTHCIIGLVLLALSAGAAASGKSAAIQNCKLRWPGDDVAITFCVQDEMAARKELRKLRRKGHSKAINYCEKQNPGAAKGIDWLSTTSCVRHILKDQKRR